MNKSELQIVIHPDERLRQKSKAFDISSIKTTKTQELVLNMVQIMLEKDGVGLAGPQVGIQKRIITVNTKDGPIALINPKIVKKSWRKETDEEGCLSVPNVYGNVKRSYKISLEAYDKNAEKIEFKAVGLFARIIQHEIDHLNGILFIDKVKKLRNLGEEVL